MAGTGPKARHAMLKPILFALILALLVFLFLFPMPASENSRDLVSKPAISAETVVVLEPGTLLLFGAGIIALGFQWMARR